MSALDGKAFEATYQKILSRTGCDCIRFYDVTNGYKKIDNPADFVISMDKDLPAILTELKVCQGSSFKLDFRQLPRLLELKKFKSVLIIWFTEYKRIVALNVTEVERLLSLGIKSLNPSKTREAKMVDLCYKFKRINPEEIEYWRLWGFLDRPIKT